MLNSNNPIKVAHPQILANQSLLNSALLMEMVSNSFSESISKENYGALIKRKKIKSKKNKDMKIYFH